MKDFQESVNDILEGLNEDQIRAICRSFTCKDYQMIIGVPGSGKHEVIARMLVLARKLKLKVLVMGVNNMHLDNLIFRVLELQEQFKDKMPAEERSRFVRVCSTSS